MARALGATSTTEDVLSGMNLSGKRILGVRAAAVHPGGIHTELARHVGAAGIQKVVDQINQQLASEGKGPFQFKTVPQGAATSVWAAVVAPPDEIGGRYCENCHVGKIVADDVLITAVSEGVRGYALDPQNAEALWKKSEELVGESFDFYSLQSLAEAHSG